MGNEPPKKFDAKSAKQKFEITCIKVKAYLEIHRDKRQMSANAKEKALVQSLSMPTRSKQDEIQKASTIILDLNYVKACNIVIRFCDILKDSSLHVIEAKGHSDKISNLMPYIESICWASKPLNLSCISEFQAQMVTFFGNDIAESVQKSAKIDPDLKLCFKELLASPLEINDYFVHLSERTGISLQTINAVGTEYAARGGPPTYPGPNGQDFPPPQGPYQPGFGGGQAFPPQHFEQNQFPSFGQGPVGGFQGAGPNLQGQGFPGGYPAYEFGQFGAPAPQFGGPPPQYQGPPAQSFGQNQFNLPPAQNNNFPPQNSGQFGPSPPVQNQNIAAGGYPEFGKIEMPGKNITPKQDNKGDMPNLDDFEERMKKLRDNLN